MRPLRGGGAGVGVGVGTGVGVTVGVSVGVCVGSPGGWGVLVEVGNAKAIGIELFSHHIIPFELASLLLLVAAVGIISLAKFTYKPLRKRTRT